MCGKSPCGIYRIYRPYWQDAMRTVKAAGAEGNVNSFGPLDQFRLTINLALNHSRLWSLCIKSRLWSGDCPWLYEDLSYGLWWWRSDWMQGSHNAAHTGTHRVCNETTAGHFPDENARVSEIENNVLIETNPSKLGRWREWETWLLLFVATGGTPVEG